MTARLLLGIASLLVSDLAYSQTGLISTYAGNGSASYSGDGGAATNASINHPFQMALDASGNLYIDDIVNSRIRKVDASTGIITTVAGGGTGGDGGPAIAASLSNPCGLKVDSAGNLYISETCISASQGGGSGGSGGGTFAGISRVRRVDAVTGIITTIAGGSTGGFGGDGGPATSALLSQPGGLAIDGAGNVYIADSGNNRIRRIDASSGLISTVAGNGAAAFSGDGGIATSASLNSPFAVALDSAGSLYVADAGNNRIRRIDAMTGIITTVAGTGSTLFNGDGISATSANIHTPYDLLVDSSGNTFFTDGLNSRVRMVSASTGLIWTIAGNGGTPTVCCWIGDGGQATNALLSVPAGLVLSSAGPLFVSEEQGNRVRRVALPSPFANTAVTVSAGATSVPSGNPVTLTAVISAINGMAAHATGGVQFFDGTAPLYGAVLVNGSVSFTTSSLAMGTHNITALYGGDSAFGISVSPVFSLTITAPQTSVVLTPSPNPSNSGQTITLTAAITPASATGTITFLNGGTTLGTATVSNGLAVLSGISFSPGSYSLTAQYSGDISHPAGTSAPVTQTVKTASSVAVTSSANPSTSGQTVTFTATVTPLSATGNVQFLDNGSVIGTATLASGVAAFSSSSLNQGAHSITASYAGDSSNTSAVSATLSQNMQAASSVALASSANPSTVGQTVTFTATVTPSTATGNVQFLDNGVAIGTAALASGVAPFSSSSLTQGAHSITASYVGDSSNAGSTSVVLSQSVKVAASVALASSANPSTVGQTVTFTATVTPSSATGNVQFLDNGVAIGTAALASGVATFSSSSLNQGAHSITASYAGDSSNMSAVSTALNQNMQAASSVALASSANPSAVGQAVTFTATVTPASATGNVQFLDNGAVIGTAALASGVAAFSSSSLTQGAHSITASYGGDSSNSSSVSAALNQNVKGVASVALAANPSPATVNQVVTFTATITPVSATGSVQFFDGTTSLGTGTVTSGVATLATAALTQGTHSITAAYGGDSSFASATSSAVTETVQANSSVGLGANTSQPFTGQSVTLTAYFNPSSATGSVQFLEGSTVLSTVAVSSGTAAFTTDPLTQGAHAFTAVYSGDANTAGSTSFPFNLSAKSSDSVVMTPSANPVTVGQTVTFTVNITPAAATGTVQFLEGGNVIGTATFSSGVATFSTSTLTQGTHLISLLYSGDANYMAASVSPYTLFVRLASSLALVTSANPATVGQSVTFTATVTPPAATGSVQFIDNGGLLIGTSTIANGVATFSTSTLTQGTHSIVASYPGDSNYVPATSVTIAEVVKATASVALSSSPNPSLAQQTVTFTATVSPAAATGTVQFLDGANVIGSATLTSGVGMFATAALTQGSHSITAVYSGSSNYTGATSAAVLQTVKVIPSVGLTSNVPNPVSGQMITFTASINPSTATGTVQFLDNGSVIATSPVSSGVATFSTASLALGAHSFTAVYSGDANVSGGTSGSVAFSVKALASLTVSTTPNPSTLGQAVTLRATVNPTTATGTVQFFDGGTAIGTASVASGAAVLTTAALGQGTHSISAVYGGDANDTGASSSAILQTVKANSSATLLSNLNPSIAGQAVTFTVSITPSTATGTVQFLNGGVSLGTVTLSNGSGLLTTTALSAGAHSIQAVYSGDAITNGSSSSVLTQIVKTATTITLTSNLNPASHLSTVTLTAKVTPKTATGTVQFFDGSTSLGTSTLSNGTATFSHRFSVVGTHSVQVVYNGDSNYGGSTSATLTETIH